MLQCCRKTRNKEDLICADLYSAPGSNKWHRNIVEGTTLEQLNRHGLEPLRHHP